MSLGILTSLLEDEGSQAGGGVGTPLDYSDLVMYLDAENGVTPGTDLSDTTQWTSQGTAFNFTIPAGQRAPFFFANSQNGLPGIEFDTAPSGTGALRRKLENGSSAFDNYFSGSGNKTISFAARINTLVNEFGTLNTLIEKGSAFPSLGWRLSVTSDGTLEFTHRRANATRWTMTAPGLYADGDLVLGSVTYDGGNSSSSGFFRVYNGTEFITTGSVSTGTGSSTGPEAANNLIIGNVLDINDNNQNQPFGGAIFGIWMTKPGSTFFDENYMARWIP